MTKRLMAGIDLHSNNVMIGVVDQDGKRVKHQKLECDIKAVEGFLKPLKPRNVRPGWQAGESDPSTSSGRTVWSGLRPVEKARKYGLERFGPVYPSAEF